MWIDDSLCPLALPNSRRNCADRSIGAALARIAYALLRDEHAVLTVSSLAPESMGLGQVSLSVPTVITRDGVARVLFVPLSVSERKALEASAETLKHHTAALNTSEAALV